MRMPKGYPAAIHRKKGILWLPDQDLLALNARVGPLARKDSLEPARLVQ